MSSKPSQEHVEYERTFVIESLKHIELASDATRISDHYFAFATDFRIREADRTHTLTKKVPLSGNLDRSAHIEYSIPLSTAEVGHLLTLPHRSLVKMRYAGVYNEHRLTVDRFEGPLAGLMLMEIEFADPQQLAHFQMPSFCTVDVTSEPFVAPGRLVQMTHAEVVDEIRRITTQPRDHT